MFESVRNDDAAARFRSAAIPPLAAFIVALLYLTIYPLFPDVPALLFWTIDAILLAGAILGAIAIIRVLRSERPRGRAIAWLVAAVIVELICARMFLGLTFPWI